MQVVAGPAQQLHLPLLPLQAGLHAPGPRGLAQHLQPVPAHGPVRGGGGRTPARHRLPDQERSWLYINTVPMYSHCLCCEAGWEIPIIIPSSVSDPDLHWIRIQHAKLIF